MLLQRFLALREDVQHAILPDLQKAYYALERSRYLGLLEGYGMRPRSLCLIQIYWERLRMVMREGGYYGAPFHG